LLTAGVAWAGEVDSKVADRLQPVRLTHGELSGEIGRRIEDLVYKNYMAIDLEHGFLDPFRKRPAAKGHRYIGVGKVISAASRFAAYTGDRAVAERTARLIGELMKTRDPDGYLGHMPVEPDGAQNWRNWILHDQEYTVLGLVDHWRFSGDVKSLAYARQVADYILSTFPKNPRPDRTCTAGLPEAMLRLYEATGDRRYLEFAASARHGNPHGEVECSSLNEWRKLPLTNRPTSHVYVNLARCYSQTLLYRFAAREDLLEISRSIFDDLTRPGGSMFVIGSASDGEHFSYEQNGAGMTSESCVTAYWIRWLDSLMRLDGNLQYGDLMERAIYNALFAAQDPAGRKLRYFTPFEGPRKYYSNDGFCCPGNYRRIVAELPEMVYYRTTDGGVAVNLFAASKKTIDLGGGRKVTIGQQTDYPTSGLVKFTVTPSAALEFPLRVRIPRWCPAARLTIGSEPTRELPGGKTCELRRVWKPGDTFVLDMPMPWRLVRGHKMQEGRVALLRGPVVYCIGAEQNADLLKKHPKPGTLVIDPASLGNPVADTAVRPEGRRVTAKAWAPGTQGRGPATLEVVLTEFVDPSGVATYFAVSDARRAVEDELISTKAAASVKTTANYARPFDTPTRRALLPLPPGAVQPAGWLRDWCLAARDGFTGHMDEYDAEFRRAWAADHTMTGARLNWPKGGWPYEGGGYWFDGLVRLGYVLHDQELLRQAKRRLDVVVSHMNPNSILFLWWLDKNKPEDVKGATVSGAWPIWASGLLGRSLAAYYAGSADTQALQALLLAYRGDRDWLRMGWGMSNPWNALETYSWTGDPEIAAALTRLFAGEGGLNPGGSSWNHYRQMPNPTPGAEKNDHVVHFLESTTPWALGYLWTGKRSLLDATLGWHDLVERYSMQPHGVIVAEEFYGPSGAFKGTETCDVAAYLWSQIVLLSVSGQGRMADRAERAFFNAGPATVCRDFKTHVYFQSPNRMVENSPPQPHGPRASGTNYNRVHYPLCCTAALNRIVPNYVMHMWMGTYDNGLAATYYGPCKLSALVADRVPVEIVCQTEYPFGETIDITVKPEREASFPLSFRIPGWCKTPTLELNGTPVAAKPCANGFVRIARTWKAGDRVRLQFPMAVQVCGGRDHNTSDAPYATVSYGPLAFALPIADTDNPNTPDPKARWKYALDVTGGTATADIKVRRQPMPAKWNWPLAAPLTLEVSAAAIDWNPEPAAPRLPAQPAVVTKPSERITLVPYGCTKFRVSMLPVTRRAWNVLEPQVNQGQRATNIPHGAAALGYAKRVINEKPAAADVAPGRNGHYKWFSGQWFQKKQPTLDHYQTRDGELAIKLGGNLVSAPLDFSRGALPLLPGADGFYVEFDVRLSDNDPDHWPAVWLMPAEHDGRHDHYEGDPPGYERFMELDVDEGGFGPGLTGTVHSTEGVWPKWKHIQNPNNVSRTPLDRSQTHTFGASYDPTARRVVWWVDGKEQMAAGAPYVPAIAAKQHFYLILSGQSHKLKKPHDTIISGVRAYVPLHSPLPEK
jgi:DUF1680 family protein